jgi:pimeloyl-ACP methyl ester carboxylesterase
MDIEQLPQPGKNNLWFRYSDSDAVLVFVHGVLSDSRGCWLYKDKKAPKNDCYWPELIASDSRFNNISIYLAGYYTAPDSGPYEIRNCADEVFEALKHTNTDKHPPVMAKKKIIFVCHSMGGIVTRYLLEANHGEFREKDVGLVLIASPSYGARLANNLNNIVTFFNQNQGIQLQWGSWSLRDLDDRFRELKEKKRIPNLSGIELYENHFIVHWKWFPLFSRTLVVSKESAGRYFGAAKQLPKTDHFSACKPRDETDLVHRYLLGSFRERTE